MVDDVEDVLGLALGHGAHGGHRAVGLLGGGEALPGACVERGVGQAGVDDEQFAEQVPASQVQPVVDPGGQPGGEVAGEAGRQPLGAFAPVGEVEDGVGDVVGDVSLDGPGFGGAAEPGAVDEFGLRGRAGRPKRRWKAESPRRRVGVIANASVLLSAWLSRAAASISGCR